MSGEGVSWEAFRLTDAWAEREAAEARWERVRESMRAELKRLEALRPPTRMIGLLPDALRYATVGDGVTVEHIAAVRQAAAPRLEPLDVDQLRGYEGSRRYPFTMDRFAFVPTSTGQPRVATYSRMLPHPGIGIGDQPSADALRRYGSPDDPPCEDDTTS